MLRHVWRTLVAPEGDHFPQAVAVALPIAALCALLKYGEAQAERYPFLEVISEWHVTGIAYSTFASPLAFLIVLRSSKAYQRFWAGCCHSKTMVVEFCDAASGILSLTLTSKAPAGKVAEFRQTTIALTSLLCAVCLCETADLDVSSEKFVGMQIIGWEDFDEETRLAMETTEEKSDLAFFWWLSYTSKACNEGVLDVPAPMVSRIFQMIGEGFGSFKQAVLLTHMPMPKAYAHTTQCLLMVHALVTPFAVLHWTHKPVIAAVLTFVLIFTTWVLFYISEMLEHPFGDDSTDIDICSLQRQGNASLQLLRSEEAKHMPQFDEAFRHGNGIMETAPGWCIFGEASSGSDTESHPRVSHPRVLCVK